MDETYRIKAIVLDRQPYREVDLLVSLYSFEKGILSFIARGAKRNSSKLAPHLEPLNLIEAMIVRGRAIDYIGSAISRNSFFNIKNDLEKVFWAGKAVAFFKKTIKESESDEFLFTVLLDFLNLINKEDIKNNNFEFLYYAFILKILSHLGHKPELFRCVKCAIKIIPGNNYFDLSGGLVCNNCKSIDNLTILDNSIKILRLVVSSPFSLIKKVSMEEKEREDIFKIIQYFADYNIS
jgi:DNA repair protein RecO (recombination protein O)